MSRTDEGMIKKDYFLRRNKITRTIFVVLISLILLAILRQNYWNGWKAFGMIYVFRSRMAPSANRTPLIVTWTMYPTQCDKEAELLIPGARDCAYKCEFIDREEQKLYNRNASAYLLHGTYINFSDLPKQSSDYLIVLLLRQSPVELAKWGNQIYKVPENYFNATMTYRSISRYFYAYGQFEVRTANDMAESVITQDQLLMALERKMKGSLVIVSVCKTASNREQKIRELGKFTEITVRSNCENLITNGSLVSDDCFDKFDCNADEVIAAHRFYIAFEKSYCEEYITDMFYQRISQLLVPVVLKRQIYEDAGIPHHSFIAADDFKTLEDLGIYLNCLRKNDTAYLRYFEWTKNYRKPDTYKTNALCKLCEDIHKKNKLHTSKEENEKRKLRSMVPRLLAVRCYIIFDIVKREMQ